MNEAPKLRELWLCLTAQGGAELLEVTGEGETDYRQLWASDSDEEFGQQFSDFLQEGDSGDVLDYLVANGVISDAEADECEVTLESLREGDGDEDEDPEEDEDEDWDEER